MHEPPVRVLISGASSGIGREFALQLAEHCDEIIVSGRRRDALESLVAQLDKRGVNASMVVADLTTTIGIAQLVETIRQRGPLRYLINSAGFSTLGPFTTREPASQEDMVQLHIQATLALSRAALAGMQEPVGGYLVNVSSLAALAPMGNLAVYAGTKAFLNNFSIALQQEVIEQHIKVQCLCPGYTRTKFHQTAELQAFDADQVPEEYWMNADQVVGESLAALHSDDESVLVIPGEVNRRLASRILEVE